MRFNYHAIVSAEFLERSFYGSSLDLIVRDGRVVAIDENLEVHKNGFVSEMWEPFRLGSSGITRTMSTSCSAIHWSSTAIRQPLWEQRRQEYLDALIVEGAHEARAAVICTAALPG